MFDRRKVTEEQYAILDYMGDVLASCTTTDHCQTFFTWVCRKIDKESPGSIYHSLLNQLCITTIGKSLELQGGV